MRKGSKSKKITFFFFTALRLARAREYTMRAAIHLLVVSQLYTQKNVMWKKNMSKENNVLSRLDTLVSSSSTGASGGTGILKKKSSKKIISKKSISFPKDDHQLQEIIGYGGGGIQEEELDDDFDDVSTKSQRDVTDDDMGQDPETTQNTTFNSSLRNLNGGEKPLLLGSTKPKNPPLVSIRPFEVTSQMNKTLIGGKLVNLGSDGDSSDSSNDDVIRGNGSSEDTSSTSSTSEDIVEVSSKRNAASAASARLSFLNSTISFNNEEDEAGKSKHYASTSILKGVSRKPPILKEKPKINRGSKPVLNKPVAAPRKQLSFKDTSTNEYANVTNEVTISNTSVSKIEVTEEEAAEDDENSVVVIEVNDQEKPPKIVNNREALESIRQSLRMKQKPNLKSVPIEEDHDDETGFEKYSKTDQQHKIRFREHQAARNDVIETRFGRTIILRTQPSLYRQRLGIQ